MISPETRPCEATALPETHSDTAMTSPEARLREAFAAVTPPEHLNKRTLAFIEQHRPSTESNSQQRAGRARMRIIAAVASLAAAACFALAFIGLGTIAPDDFELANPSLNAADSDPHSNEQTTPVANASENTTAAAFITLDVNPSIELALDENDIVLSAHGLNDDGAAVLQGPIPAEKATGARSKTNRAGESLGSSLEGLHAEEALASLVSSEAFAPYLKDDAYVTLTIACDNPVQRERIVATGQICLDALPCQGSCHTATLEERAQAAEAGMGVQRYRAAQELMELDPALTWDDCRSMSMRELRDRIVQLEESPESTEQETTGHQDDHQGDRQDAHQSGQHRYGQEGNA